MRRNATSNVPTPTMADRLRALLDRPQGLELPGCYDVLSAMVLERAGFEAVFMSGYGLAASLLGNPDIGLTSLVETSTVTRNVTSAIGVPLVVDADNGYGNEDNAVRTVTELEHAGAAAMILEDQVSPKRCGHAAGKQIIPLDQYTRKLECALRARKTRLVVVARTDATSIDEGIARARRFQEVGADVVLIDGLASIEALKRVGAEVPGHKVINLIHGGKTPLLSASELHAFGFKIVLYSTPALYTATHTILRAMKVLRESGRLESISADSVTFPEFQHWIESRYLERDANAGLTRVTPASNGARASGSTGAGTFDPSRRSAPPC